MKKIKLALMAVLVLSGMLLTFSSSMAASPTKDQAKAMVEKAIQFYKDNGRAKAMDEINKPDGKLSQGAELFVFAIDSKGNVLAHPFNHALIGKDMSNVKDADGKYFSREMAETANTKGSGWIDYKWTNPASKKTEPKSTFVQKADDVIFACGIYVK